MRLVELGKRPSVAIILCAALSAAQAGAQTPVLIIHSYTEDYPWTKRQHEGFVAALSADPALIPAYTAESLDTKRRDYDGRYASQFADYLRFKYQSSGYRPALIYVTDDDALSFALQFSQGLFPDAPIFFSGINDYGKRDTLDPAQATGVFERKDIATNLAFLLRMDPALHNIILVGDGSSTYEAIAQDARAKLQQLPGIHATFIAEKRLDRLLEQVRQQASTYLFLTTVGGLTDADGQALPLSQSIPKIVQLGRFVILSMEDVYMVQGVAGGFVTSGWRQGEGAGRLALAYLHGTPMAQLPPLTDSPNEYVFDADELAQRKLRLPADIRAVATLLTQQPSFYQRNKNEIVISLYILAALLFFVLEGSLIIVARKNRRIRQSEAQYRELVMNADTIILKMDMDGTVSFFNEYAERFFGFAQAEILGKPVVGTIVPATETATGRDLHRLIEDILVNPKAFEANDNEHMTKDGRRVYVHWSNRITYDPQGRPSGVLSIGSDITERKQAAEALQRLNETLEQRVQAELAENRGKDHLIIQQSRFAAMGEMIGNIAHQWRQPLNALGLTLANIEDAYHYHELTPEYLAKQVAGGKHLVQTMSATIDDFRNFFRPHKEALPFSARAAINQAIALVVAGCRNHHIEIGLEPGEDAIIDGFPNEYSQVLINLLVNAKEAILTRQVANGKVNLRLACDGRWVTVLVADNGGGIPADILEKIFEPYFSTKAMGTGIGLYMSKMIIEKSMHGHLSVRNQGDGAEFAVRCPLSAKQVDNPYANPIDRT